MTVPRHAIEDLAARVLVGIEETERIAQAATAGPWKARLWPGLGTGDVETEDNLSSIAYDSGGAGACESVDALHIAHNDPQVVLRRCEADRRTVQRHEPRPLDDDYATCHWCGQVWPCPDLLDRAQAYDITTGEVPSGR